MGNSALTTVERATSSLTLRSMISSTCSSHFSTAPLASDVEMFWINWTRSPSLLYMACITTVNVNLETFFRPWQNVKATTLAINLPGYPNSGGSPAWKYPRNTFSGGAELAVGPWFQKESQAFHHWTRKRTWRVQSRTR